jgi:hypothetical protein
MFNQMVKYTPDVLNRTFAALADPTRRASSRILRAAINASPSGATAPDVVTGCLKTFTRAGKRGLLRRRRYGRVHEMQLEARPLKHAAQWIEEYRRFWEGSLDRLAEYLEKTNRRADRKGRA